MRQRKVYDNSDIPDEDLSENLLQEASILSHELDAEKSEVSSQFLKDFKILARNQYLSKQTIIAFNNIYNLQDFSSEATLLAETAPVDTKFNTGTLKFFWNWAHQEYGPICPINTEQKTYLGILQYEYRRLCEYCQIPSIRAKLKKIANI